MTGNQARRLFLEYFQKHHHQIVRSSSLVPHDDPTLLFINAGMVQFKRVFLGEEKRPYVRATTPFLRCWGTSPSATISRTSRSSSPGTW
jgi:alanyl-tRNA synthetase